MSKRDRPKKPQPSCIVPDCGRPYFARGLCQTHHRQLLTTGKVKEIRPYRKRTDGTVKFAGPRLQLMDSGIPFSVTIEGGRYGSWKLGDASSTKPIAARRNRARCQR